MCHFSRNQFLKKKRTFSISSVPRNEFVAHIKVSKQNEIDAILKGAKWDPLLNLWAVSNNEANLFKDITIEYRTYVRSTFADRIKLKQLGAKWDAISKNWYIPGGTSTNDFISNNFTFWTLPPPTGVAFFNIETTGLPVQLLDYSDVKSFERCRIVQVSCMLCSSSPSLRQVDLRDCLIRSDGFPIPEEAAAIHGISLSRSLSEGRPFPEAVAEILPLLLQAEFLLAHNADFDLTIFKSELCRYNMPHAIAALDKLKVVCTLKDTTDIVKAQFKGGGKGYKSPKLSELFLFATGETLVTGEEVSSDNVKNLHRAIKQLVGDKKFSF
jgi:DNA polymerase III epsilon subunit-like protein